MTRAPVHKKLVLSTTSIKILQDASTTMRPGTGPVTRSCRTSDEQLKRDIKKL